MSKLKVQMKRKDQMTKYMILKKVFDIWILAFELFLVESFLIKREKYEKII